MTAPLLELQRLHKEYVNGDEITPVLHEINLQIQRGEFVALMGPSGSGKSTLMHILGLLDRPTDGEYLFNGRNVASYGSDTLAMLRRNEIGFIFQAFHLLPKATVLENVMLPLVYKGAKPKDRERLAKEALEAVGLSDRLTHLPSQISGGQRQRAAIARALINDPLVIFADEPTGNLDSKSSAQVMNILSELNQQGRTIVMVTHEQDIAEYAKRIVKIKDGVITSDHKQI